MAVTDDAGVEQRRRTAGFDHIIERTARLLPADVEVERLQLEHWPGLRFTSPLPGTAPVEFIPLGVDRFRVFIAFAPGFDRYDGEVIDLDTAITILLRVARYGAVSYRTWVTMLARRHVLPLRSERQLDRLRHARRVFVTAAWAPWS